MLYTLASPNMITAITHTHTHTSRAREVLTWHDKHDVWSSRFALFPTRIDTVRARERRAPVPRILLPSTRSAWATDRTAVR